MSGFDSGRTGASVVASLNRADQLPDPAGHPAGRAIRTTGSGGYAVETLQAEDIPLAGPAPDGTFSAAHQAGNLIFRLPWQGNPTAQIIDTVNRLQWNTDFGLDFNEVLAQGQQGGQYSRGCTGPDGKLYFAPWAEDRFLVIDPRDNSAIKTDFGNPIGSWTFEFSTGVHAHSYQLIHGCNGKLYSIPYGLNRPPVIIDVAAGTSVDASYANIMTGTSFQLHELWNGGALAPNGKIYCAPYNRATEVLVIDTSDDTAVLQDWGLDLAGLGTYRFGQPTLGPDGKIYMPPYNVDKALVIDPVADTAVLEDWGLPFVVDTFAYYTSILGSDGRIYCPDNAGSLGMLIIDPLAGTAEFGPTVSGNGPVMLGDSLWVPGDTTKRIRLR